MKKILIATGNKHKLTEIRDILSVLDLEVVGANDLNLEVEVDENADSYKGNALIKALAYHKICDLPVLADDSGIEILAFDRQPGIHSARYLGSDTPYLEKNTYILNKLKDADNRQAEFVSALAFVLPNGEQKLFEARLLGEIGTSIAGSGGFGYDPIFKIDDNHTLADLSFEEKNEKSHRALALKQFIKYLRESGLLDGKE